MHVGLLFYLYPPPSPPQRNLTKIVLWDKGVDLGNCLSPTANRFGFGKIGSYHSIASLLSGFPIHILLNFFPLAYPYSVWKWHTKIDSVRLSIWLSLLTQNRRKDFNGIVDCQKSYLFELFLTKSLKKYTPQSAFYFFKVFYNFCVKRDNLIDNLTLSILACKHYI